MEEGRSCKSSQYQQLFETLQPYLMSIFANICYAGYGIIAKMSLNRGMSRYVLIVYGHAIATLTTALFALVVERESRPKIKLPILLRIFFLGLLGPILARTGFYAGLGYTSATFASLVTNLFPSVTFLLAILSGMEKLEMGKTRSRAKIVGTVVALGGATLMTLYKGIVVIYPPFIHSHKTWANEKGSVDKDWIKGSIILIASSFSLAGFYVLQAWTLKRYPAPVSLTSLTCCMGTVQAAILTAITEHKASAWRLGWDITLVASVYTGVMVFAITTYVQLLVMRKRGPVFATAFSPVGAIIVAIMGLLILGETLYMGSVLGAVLIVVGLYMVLWGKKEERDKRGVGQVLYNGHVQRASHDEAI